MKQRGDLDSVVETILVDAYGDDEQYVAFLTVIEEEARLPAAATLLGAPVTVTGLDYTNEARGLVAICGRQPLPACYAGRLRLRRCGSRR
jgi:hypothetical protein